MEKNILVLGESGTGKTHFAVQLFGRLLKSSKTAWKPESNPENLEIFKNGFEKLAKGLEIEHTPSEFHKDISFFVVNEDGIRLKFTYPDYAGEQLRNLVNERRLNTIWKDRVKNSTSWLLFIKISDVEFVEDITSRGMPEFGALVESRSKEGIESFKLADQAFYVELLQMLVHFGESSLLNPAGMSVLTIMLSCYDELKALNTEKMLPLEILKSKMPMLFSFLESNWPVDNLKIIGLSSTERKLNDKIADEDYLDTGPEHFGYWVKPDGHEERDLTQIITLVNNG